MKSQGPLKIQDAGCRPPDPLPPGGIFVYHTHGRRQYYGTCKYHRDPNCSVLLNWEPGYLRLRSAWREDMSDEEKKRFQLAKTVMREWWDKESDIKEQNRCKRCWKKKSERKDEPSQSS